jgi:hypothetical protein
MASSTYPSDSRKRNNPAEDSVACRYSKPRPSFDIMKPLLLEREPTYCDTLMCSHWSGRCLIGLTIFCLVVGLVSIALLASSPSLRDQPIAIIAALAFLLLGGLSTRTFCIAREQLTELRRDTTVWSVQKSEETSAV